MRTYVLMFSYSLLPNACALASVVEYQVSGTVAISSRTNVPAGTPFVAIFGYDTSALKTLHQGIDYPAPPIFSLTLAGVTIVDANLGNDFVRLQNLLDSGITPYSSLTLSYRTAPTDRSGEPLGTTLNMGIEFEKPGYWISLELSQLPPLSLADFPIRARIGIVNSSFVDDAYYFDATGLHEVFIGRAFGSLYFDIASMSLIPEPSSAALLNIGLIGLAVVAGRRRRNHAALRTGPSYDARPHSDSG